jgi:hypothetical protein
VLSDNRAVVIEVDDARRICIGRIVVRERFDRYLRSLPEKQREIMELIDAAPTLSSSTSWNPVEMVKTVNALLAMGEQGAFEALDDYLTILRDWAEGFPRANDWWVEDQRVQAIAMLLWSGDLLNISPLIGGPSGLPGSVYDTIPLVFCVSDIPYLTASGYMLLGMPEGGRGFIQRIREEGKWRDAPLKPADNPFRTCLEFEERIEELAEPDDWGLDQHYWRSFLRRQSLRCAGIDTGRELYTRIDDSTIQMLATGADALSLRWDAGEQAYFMGE